MYQLILDIRKRCEANEKLISQINLGNMGTEYIEPKRKKIMHTLLKSLFVH